MLESKLKARIS